MEKKCCKNYFVYLNSFKMVVFFYIEFNYDKCRVLN